MAGNKVRVAGKPLPALLAELRTHKVELAALLSARTKPTIRQERSEPPAWPDVDGWRRHWREAVDVPSRRRVLAAWVAAAGGRLRDLCVCLPAGLPRRLARAEMVANAGYVGLTVTPTVEVERILRRAANATTREAILGCSMPRA